MMGSCSREGSTALLGAFGGQRFANAVDGGPQQALFGAFLCSSHLSSSAPGPEAGVLARARPRKGLPVTARRRRSSPTKRPERRGAAGRTAPATSPRRLIVRLAHARRLLKGRSIRRKVHLRSSSDTKGTFLTDVPPVPRAGQRCRCVAVPQVAMITAV